MEGESQKLTDLAVTTGDYILSGLVQAMAGIIGALLGLSPLETAKLGKKIYDNKGLIFSLILSPFVIIALLFLSGSNNSNTNLTNSPNTQETSLEGINATVLKVPYFNQWLEPDGSYSPTQPKIPVGGEQWDLGNVICGAASSVMVAGYYGKLPYNLNDEHDLKRFAYSDEGLHLPSKCNTRSIGGAFGMTAYDSNCNQSSFAGMSNYLSTLGLIPNSIGALTFEKVKSAIDRGHPLIVSITAPYGHISVIKGYTADGRLVMNDPFRNIQDSSSSQYSYQGKNALYQVNTGWTVNFVMEVSD
jgi:Peptidase_C39 like family